MQSLKRRFPAALVLLLLSFSSLFVLVLRRDPVAETAVRRAPATGSIDTGIRQPAGSILTQSFLDCMVDVGQNLPISVNGGSLAAHHYLAGRSDKWNDGIRFASFEPFGLNGSSLVMDVGGNTEAGDSRFFQQSFDPHLHIFEPVPPFFSELQKNWEGARKVTLHSVGLGADDRVVQLSKDSVRGHGTFAMEGHNGADGSFPLMIVDAATMSRKVMAQHYKQEVDLLHINCEGCEWELLMRLMATNMLGSFRFIQISFHNYGKEGIGKLLPQYCLIREALERTHGKIVAIPFGWERWARRS